MPAQPAISGSRTFQGPGGGGGGEGPWVYTYREVGNVLVDGLAGDQWILWTEPTGVADPSVASGPAAISVFVNGVWILSFGADGTAEVLIPGFYTLWHRPTTLPAPYHFDRNGNPV